MRIGLFILVMALSWQSFSQVNEYQLNNGLKLLVKEDHRAPVAVSMIWYKVGSADEPGGITGVSHALEHMMFKGTPRFPLGVFSKTIATLGGQENAFTNTDYTAYFEKLTATELATSFELEADRMQNLLLDKNEFAKEIKVIREERRQRTDDNPQALAYERFLAAAHLATPYHHPVVGWMSDLYHLTIDDLRSWYQRFYTPNNATLVVVGDVNAEQVHQLAIHYFGTLKKGGNSHRRIQQEPPGLGPKKLKVYAQAQLPLLILGYTVPSANTAQHSWEPYALEIIAGLLDAGENARFAKNLVRGTHIATGVDAYYNIYSRYQTQFVLMGTPSQNHNLKELKAGIFEEIKRLQNAPINDTELQQIKTQIIAQKTFEKDSIFGQAMELGLLETVGLGWQTADKYIDRITAVTAEQIQQVSKDYFQGSTMTETQLLPSTNEVQE